MTNEENLNIIFLCWINFLCSLLCIINACVCLFSWPVLYGRRCGGKPSVLTHPRATRRGTVWWASGGRSLTPLAWQSSGSCCGECSSDVMNLSVRKGSGSRHSWGRGRVVWLSGGRVGMAGVDASCMYVNRQDVCSFGGGVASAHNPRVRRAHHNTWTDSKSRDYLTTKR